MTRSRSLSLAAIVVVLAAYAYFGGNGKFAFGLISWRESYYASLAEGFLRGQLSMAHEPPPALAQLPDPYIHAARKAAGIRPLWDASYFEGKYYLYYSPVPALLFHIPLRLLTGGYPRDTLATTFFASVAFLLFVLALRRGLRGRELRIPFWFWILVLGIGNVIPYVLVRPAMYQVAISCAIVFTAGFAYALMRVGGWRLAVGGGDDDHSWSPANRQPPTANRWAFVMGACAAMAIATRPNLAVLLVVAAVVILRSPSRWRLAFMFAVPLAIVGGAAMLYNYARFRSLFELGIQYQLTSIPMRDCSLCGVRNWPEVKRLANGVRHYVLWPPAVHDRFPYLEAQLHRLDPAVSYPGRPEPVLGIVWITPIVLVGTAFAFLRRGRGAWLVVAGWLVLLALSSCWWVTARYTLDFLWLMLAGAILCTEEGLATLAESGRPIRAMRIACVALCIWSIAAGLLLPISRGL